MTKQLTQAQVNVKSLTKMLDNETVKGQFKRALDDHAPTFMASVIELASNDSYLAKCEPQSILTAALALSTLKLPINKNLGFAYIVPYNEKGKQKAQAQIGYKGLIQLAQRTGCYKHINTDVVYEGELVSCDKLTGEVDLTGEKTSDTIIGYFAYIETNYGFKKTVYWTKEAVEKHAARFSKSYKQSFSPWKSDFNAMAKKTVLKYLLSHYGYMTIEIGETMAKVEEQEQQDFDFEIEPEEKTGLEAFADDQADKAGSKLDKLIENGVEIELDGDKE